MEADHLDTPRRKPFLTGRACPILACSGRKVRQQERHLRQRGKIAPGSATPPTQGERLPSTLSNLPLVQQKYAQETKPPTDGAGRTRA